MILYDTMYYTQLDLDSFIASFSSEADSIVDRECVTGCIHTHWHSRIDSSLHLQSLQIEPLAGSTINV